jgi:hypothetical protein
MTKLRLFVVGLTACLTLSTALPLGRRASVLFTDDDRGARNDAVLVADGANQRAGGDLGGTVATKSGSNVLSGTVFQYLRNDAFDARNFFVRKVSQADGETRPPTRSSGTLASNGSCLRPWQSRRRSSTVGRCSFR